MDIARDYLKMPVYEKDVFIDNLDEFKEAGACGTAAVITPIGGIEYNGNFHVFHSETEVGPITKELYRILCGIQFGDIEGPKGWIYEVDL
jgi:branched-chain amino acid aminotransferase